MKQYCRYCCHLCVGDAIYCGERKETMSESTAKSPNRCHSFAFNPMDAFNFDKEYQPRKPKKAQCDGQMRLEV